METKMYQEIFDYIQDMVPKGWRRIIFLAIYPEGAHSIKFFVQGDDGKYVDCHDMEGIDSMQLINMNRILHKSIALVREKLDTKSKWSSMTMIIENDGKFKAEYDYDDITENYLFYEEKWRNKYL